MTLEAIASALDSIEAAADDVKTSRAFLAAALASMSPPPPGPVEVASELVLWGGAGATRDLHIAGQFETPPPVSWSGLPAFVTTGPASHSLTFINEPTPSELGVYPVVAQVEGVDHPVDLVVCGSLPPK